MTARLMEYAAISAKTRALYRNVLTEEDYGQLLSKNSVSEIAAYLKGYTHYDVMFKDIKQHEVHRGELEIMLTRSLTYEYARLMSFCTGNKKRFLNIFIIGYEIETIKNAIRMLKDEVKPDIQTPEYYRKHMTVDEAKLLEATTLSGLVEQLKGTEYYRILTPFAKESQENLFNIEMSLDIYYYKYAWKLRNKLLLGRDQELITDSLGSEIDMLNLMFIIRSKRFFNASKEYMYAFLLPIHYKISTVMMKQILEADTLDGTMKLIRQTFYKDMFEVEEGHYIEERYTRFNFNKQYRRFRNEPNSIGTLMGYMHIKAVEVRNLIMIIEGKRYSQDRDVIEKYIVKR